MKILSIRFCNLNSLAGTWYIDLTTPEYSTDGIFAITGPTGAGKSTILDAICLALYGQTPRLKVISKSTNELMTRQTGECWSEVEFSTNKGRYRCHWGQHRARKKPEGDFQPPRHEIVNCETNKPLETKIKQVAQKVIEVTGMDFNQFTRSILLAQGEFNTFLRANPDERAPILEQITGTNIYSKISQKVHDRKSEQQRKFDQLQAECEGFTPLEDIQLAEITEQHEELSTKAGKIKATMEQYQAILDWYTTQERLQKEAEVHNHALKKQQAQLESMEPQRLRLANARKAATVEHKYTFILESRKIQKHERSEHEKEVVILQALTEELEKTIKRETEGQSALLDIQREVKELESTLRQVRSLDQQILNLNLQKQERGEELANSTKKKQELEESYQRFSSQILSCESDIARVEKYRDQNPKDHRLLEEFSGIRHQLERFGELHKQRFSLVDIVNTLGKDIDHQKNEITVKRKDVAISEVKHKEVEQLESSIKLQLAELLKDSSLEQFYRKVTAIQEKLFHLKETEKLLNQYKKYQQELLEIIASEKQTGTELKAVQAELTRYTKEHLHCKAAVNKQQKIVLLASKVHNFEKQRATLQNGEPCPLCGSVSHPYRDTPGPTLSKEEHQLAKERDLLEDVENTLRSLQKSEASCLEKSNQQTRAKTSKQRELQVSEASLIEVCQQLQLQVNQEVAAEIVKQTDVLLHEQKHLQQTIQTIQTTTNRLTEVSTERSTLEQTMQSCRQKLQDLLHELEKKQLALEQHTSKKAELDEHLKKNTSKLNLLLVPYGIAPLSGSSYQSHINRLGKKRAEWIKQEEKYQQAQKKVFKIRTLHTSLRDQLEETKKICDLKQGIVTKLAVSLDGLCKDRHQLFGDKAADTAEQQMQNNLTLAEGSLATLKKQLNNMQQQYATHLGQEQATNKRIRDRTVELETMHNVFCETLKNIGFIDEQDFLTNRLEPSACDEIEEALQKQKKTIDELTALLKSAQASLTNERNRCLTEIPLADINTLLHEQRDLLAEVQQKTGALNQQLVNNKKLQQLHSEKLQKLTAQKTELERWGRLHELIGSNDGKKFRNFAQGLTFEIMIGHANRSLRKMSDRYLLWRNPSQPLELQVIDNYQAGEVRSTKNLSGGESFIVSMALALGLSAMASHKVQVDSLFLDEGFGTLDEDSLQTALDTLASLQQEGKLIGIISHVSGLRERISTQIQVNRGSGGFSTLAGPGIGSSTN